MLNTFTQYLPLHVILHLYSCVGYYQVFTINTYNICFSRFILLQHLLSWYVLGTWKSKTDIICDWYADIFMCRRLQRKTLNAKHITCPVIKSEGLCQRYHGDSDGGCQEVGRRVRHSHILMLTDILNTPVLNEMLSFNQEHLEHQAVGFRISFLMFMDIAWTILLSNYWQTTTRLLTWVHCLLREKK